MKFSFWSCFSTFLVPLYAYIKAHTLKQINANLYNRELFFAQISIVCCLGTFINGYLLNCKIYTQCVIWAVLFVISHIISFPHSSLVLVFLCCDIFNLFMKTYFSSVLSVGECLIITLLHVRPFISLFIIPYSCLFNKLCIFIHKGIFKTNLHFQSIFHFHFFPSTVFELSFMIIPFVTLLLFHLSYEFLRNAGYNRNLLLRVVFVVIFILCISFAVCAITCKFFTTFSTVQSISTLLSQWKQIIWIAIFWILNACIILFFGTKMERTTKSEKPLTTSFDYDTMFHSFTRSFFNTLRSYHVKRKFYHLIALCCICFPLLISETSSQSLSTATFLVSTATGVMMGVFISVNVFSVLLERKLNREKAGKFLKKAQAEEAFEIINEDERATASCVHKKFKGRTKKSDEKIDSTPPASTDSCSHCPLSTLHSTISAFLTSLLDSRDLPSFPLSHIFLLFGCVCSFLLSADLLAASPQSNWHLLFTTTDKIKNFANPFFAPPFSTPVSFVWEWEKLYSSFSNKNENTIKDDKENEIIDNIQESKLKKFVESSSPSSLQPQFTSLSSSSSSSSSSSIHHSPSTDINPFTKYIPFILLRISGVVILGVGDAAAAFVGIFLSNFEDSQKKRASALSEEKNEPDENNNKYENNRTQLNQPQAENNSNSPHSLLETDASSKSRERNRTQNRVTFHCHRHVWPHTQKCVEGTIAAVISSMLCFFLFLLIDYYFFSLNVPSNRISSPISQCFEAVFLNWKLWLSVIIVFLVEAFTPLNDNLVLSLVSNIASLLALF
ncbi:uncharacterized protein MONOS_4764p1 [Monocercomonoides exilis]|uniref:uncharacterized protein n=1 Tax=Monocercomonoides exilis TaxID=2049356 RepID=UPI003559FFCD|nr:hypothetical protein MONOS_4764p1 [Monocercomonoides exilis]